MLSASLPPAGRYDEVARDRALRARDIDKKCRRGEAQLERRYTVSKESASRKFGHVFLRRTGTRRSATSSQDRALGIHLRVVSRPHPAGGQVGGISFISAVV